MNVGCKRITLINSAKEKLALHKDMGQRSGLSIMEVAHLLDIVSGKSIPSEVPPNLLLTKNFISLN
jgi:hypothetical protein